MFSLMLLSPLVGAQVPAAWGPSDGFLREPQRPGWRRRRAVAAAAVVAQLPVNSGSKYELMPLYNHIAVVLIVVVVVVVVVAIVVVVVEEDVGVI